MGILKKIGRGLFRFSFGLFKVALAIGAFLIYYIGALFFSFLSWGE